MTIATGDARNQIDQAIERVVRDGERIVIERAGQPVAALVPIEDLEFLEHTDEIADHELHAAREAQREPGGVSLEEVKARLGLD